MYLSTGGGTGSGFDFHSPMDIFDMFFGGGGRGRSRGPQKGKDVIHQLKVSLEDLYNGTTRKLSLKKKVICAKCDGLYSYCVLLFFCVRNWLMLLKIYIMLKFDI
jgi:DnaJ-class molecular chaperone